MSKQLSMFEEKEKTLQDLRNELQEMKYKDYYVNDYGTEYQITESVLRAQENQRRCW